jgi:hypothetical protein
MRCLNSNGILAAGEFDFWKDLSMEKATHETLEALNSKMLATGIFCDLAKALDCVLFIYAIFNDTFTVTQTI